MWLQKSLLYTVWLFIVVSFICGVTLPMATVQKFMVFENEFSLFGSLVKLASDPRLENIILLLIIGSFSLLFPVAKLVTMFLQIRQHGNQWENTMTRIIETVGHFSMLDVFIVALMVLLLKLEVLVNITILAGFYWFSFSIVTSIVLSAYLRWSRRSRS